VHLLRGAVLAEPGPGDIAGGQLLPRGHRGHQLLQVGRAVLLIAGLRGFRGLRGLRGLRVAVVPADRIGGVRVGGGERG